MFLLRFSLIVLFLSIGIMAYADNESMAGVVEDIGYYCFKNTGVLSTDCEEKKWKIIEKILENQGKKDKNITIVNNFQTPVNEGVIIKTEMESTK